MKLRVYAGRTCFILVPEFLLPPPATALFTPLKLHGFIDETDIPAAELAIIKGEITRSYYSVVPESVVDVWNLIACA